MPIASVGFIGLGTMGLPMARNILKAGFELAVYDVRPESVRVLADDGAVACGSCREVADRSEAIVSIVPDVEQVEQIMLGADGVLLNTGIAGAKDPIAMAIAMRHALEAGLLARQAGRIPKKLYATASSPIEGVIGDQAS